jgi:hypothetical protein
MRALVVGTLPEAVRRVEEQLQGAGHDVVRCHGESEAAFPCAGLADGGSCPLDGVPVDVAVTVRDRPWEQPSPFEDGAVCALRQHIPLVAVDAAVNPFEAWTTRAVESGDDVVAACEDAASAPLAQHSKLATEAAREVIARHGFEPANVTAVVRRRQGALKVTVELPDPAAGLRGMIASRVVTALRKVDGASRGIDVGVVSAP